MEYKEFKTITKVLEKNYQKNISEDILKIWYYEFKKYSKRQYKRIVLEALKRYKFVPTLAEMLEIEVLPEWVYEEIKVEEVKLTGKEGVELEDIKRNLDQHKPFGLYYENEFFDSFKYDERNRRYQSNSGYLSISKVYEIAKGIELERKIIWGE